MVSAATATHFWAAVEDCLVTFHGLERVEAAATVTALQRRLPPWPEPPCGEPSFADMIYHAEPWHVASNVTGRELPLENHQAEYTHILRENGLA